MQYGNLDAILCMLFIYINRTGKFPILQLEEKEEFSGNIRKKMMKLRNFLTVFTALCITAAIPVCGAEAKSKTPVKNDAGSNAKTEVQAKQQKIANELDQLSSGMAPNSGKKAVVKRLAALFRNTAHPVIPTKKFVPAAPYIALRHIESKDPLVPARTLIIYRLRFMQADDKTQDAIEGLIGESGTVEFSEKQNMVIINVPRERAEIVKEMLIALDQPTPQVLVETQVIEVLVENGQERDVQVQYSQYDAKTGTKDVFGLNLTNPGQGNNAGQESGVNFFPISKISDDGSYKQLQFAIKWLATSTDSKLLAAPNIIAELGTDAKMTTGEEIPFAEAAVTTAGVSQNIKFKKTGINLSIKPVIINNDTVRLEIKPEIIQAVRYQSFVTADAQSTVPVVSIRNISTTLTAADGEIIMLGGLYSSETIERQRKTPFLSDIPIVGPLFTARSLSVSDKQLIFFMKIHILKSPYSVFIDLEKSASELQDVGRSIRLSKTMFKSQAEKESKAEKSFFSMKLLQDPDALWDAIFDSSAADWTRVDYENNGKKEQKNKKAAPEGK